MVCLIKCVWFNIFSLFGPMYDLINRYGLYGREEYDECQAESAKKSLILLIAILVQSEASPACLDEYPSGWAKDSAD